MGHRAAGSGQRGQRLRPHTPVPWGRPQEVGPTGHRHSFLSPTRGARSTGRLLTTLSGPLVRASRQSPSRPRATLAGTGSGLRGGRGGGGGNTDVARGAGLGLSRDGPAPRGSRPGRSGLSGEQGREFVLQGEGPLKHPCHPGGRGEEALAVTEAPSRRLCSQRLTAKAASALLALGLGEGDVEGLEAEGPGLGHFGGLGGWDGRAVGQRGAEAWRRAVMCCGGEARGGAGEPGAWGGGLGGGAAPCPAPTRPEPWAHC